MNSQRPCSPSLAKSHPQPTPRPHYRAASQTSEKDVYQEQRARPKASVVVGHAGAESPCHTATAAQERPARRRGGAERVAVSVGPLARGACVGSSPLCISPGPRGAPNLKRRRTLRNLNLAISQVRSIAITFIRICSRLKRACACLTPRRPPHPTHPHPHPTPSPLQVARSQAPPRMRPTCPPSPRLRSHRQAAPPPLHRAAGL